MSKYQEQLDILDKFISEDGASCDEEILQNAIRTLQELIDDYEYMKNDVELAKEEIMLLKGKTNEEFRKD